MGAENYRKWFKHDEDKRGMITFAYFMLARNLSLSFSLSAF
jgi:hypothetical protein